MPIHDWTQVDAGIFHSFHLSWIAELTKALNGGVLPDGYYSLAEQHADRKIPDLVALHVGRQTPTSSFESNGVTAVLDSPPKVARKMSIEYQKGKPRTVAIRHVSGDRLVAIIEIVSPGNKDRKSSVEEIAGKIEDAVKAGIHALVIDLFPVGRHDPCGIHGVVYKYLANTSEAYDLPSKKSLTLASYAAGEPIHIYLEHPFVGDALIDMPVFLESDYYVNVPLEPTYAEAFRSFPAIYRNVLQRPKAKPAKK